MHVWVFCVYTCILICMCTYIYIYTYIHTYIYIQICVCVCLFSSLSLSLDFLSVHVMRLESPLAALAAPQPRRHLEVSAASSEDHPKYFYAGPYGIYYLESQYPIIMGYFQSIMGYFGV